MTLATSLRGAARSLITKFGNDSTIYNFSSAHVTYNNEGEATIRDWNSTTIIDACDALTGWTDSTDMTTSLNTTTYQTGNTAINLTKDGTTTAVASSDKTITSFDFTSKTLTLWVYIADTATLNKMATTACLEIRLGSSSSVYYSWTKNKANLSVGWNQITSLTSSNGTAVGTPTITAMVYLYVGLTTTTTTDVWSAGSVIMDDIYVTSSYSTIKIVDGNNIKYNQLQAEMGLENIGDDDKIVRDDVTVAVNDRLTADSVEYKVIEVQPVRTQSTLVVQMIRVVKVTSTTVW